MTRAEMLIEEIDLIAPGLVKNLRQLADRTADVNDKSNLSIISHKIEQWYTDAMIIRGAQAGKPSP